MVRRDVGRLAFLRVGLHLRCIFPCYAAEHAIIHLDRYLYRLHHRRTNSRNLGRRYALLFGSVAQCRRCLCGVVARVSSVNMIATRLNQLLKNEKNLRHESAPSPLLVRMHPRGDRRPDDVSDLDLLPGFRLSVICVGQTYKLPGFKDRPGKCRRRRANIFRSERRCVAADPPIFCGGVPIWNEREFQQPHSEDKTG